MWCHSLALAWLWFCCTNVRTHVSIRMCCMRSAHLHAHCGIRVCWPSEREGLSHTDGNANIGIRTGMRSMLPSKRVQHIKHSILHIYKFRSMYYYYTNMWRHFCSGFSRFAPVLWLRSRVLAKLFACSVVRRRRRQVCAVGERRLWHAEIDAFIPVCGKARWWWPSVRKHVWQNDKSETIRFSLFIVVGWWQLRLQNRCPFVQRDPENCGIIVVCSEWKVITSDRNEYTREIRNYKLLSRWMQTIHSNRLNNLSKTFHSIIGWSILW